MKIFLVALLLVGLVVSDDAPSAESVDGSKESPVELDAFGYGREGDRDGDREGDREGTFKCYWTDDCGQRCRENEYVAAASTQMMCRRGRSCPASERRANKLCCPIPRHLYRIATDTPNYQPWQSPILPILSLACGILGGINCPNQPHRDQQSDQPQLQDQPPQQPAADPQRGFMQPYQPSQYQNYDFDCRWTEECGRPCRVGEFMATESRRWASGSNSKNDRTCRPNEGMFRYCCKGPRVIWTNSYNEIY